MSSFNVKGDCGLAPVFVSRALDGWQQKGTGPVSKSLARILLERRLAFHVTKDNAVINTLKQVFKMEKYEMVAVHASIWNEKSDPYNHTRWKHECADKTIHTREEGPTVQLCGDSEVAGKWIHGDYSLRQKYCGRIGQIQKTLQLWRRKTIWHHISKIDVYVKHIFRETQFGSRSLGQFGCRGREKKYCRQRQ